MGDLRDLLSEPPTVATRQQLVTILDGMFEMLPFRIAAKEKGGYLTEVTKKFPGWADQVNALGAEHGILYEELRELRREAHEESNFLSRAQPIFASLGEWMERFGRHEREERRLVQMATNLELGVGA